LMKKVKTKSNYFCQQFPLQKKTKRRTPKGELVTQNYIKDLKGWF
jgi:hypothetical protein